MQRPGTPQRVLILFNTLSLYGMERGVIQIFDMLRPEVIPHFLMSYTTYRKNLAILEEVKRRDLPHSFFTDRRSWPKIAKPKSLKHFFQLMVATIKGNIDVLRKSLDKSLLYIPSVPYFYFAILACLWYRCLRRRVIFHFHDLITQPSLHLQLVKLFVTDFIHCSQIGYRQVVSANPCVLKKRNFVLPYRTDGRISGAKEGWLKGNFKGKRNVVFFGQVSPHKGVDILIEAFRQIVRLYDNIALHIVGGCDSVEFKDEFCKLISANDVRGKIWYWGYQQDIDHLLDVADIHIQPSPPSRFMDTFPLAVLEAMRRGVPTVCFRSGGLPEMVIHGQTGLICEKEDPECLADSLRRLLDDSEFRNYCGQQALDRYEKNYSDIPVRKQWLQFFEDRT